MAAIDPIVHELWMARIRTGRSMRNVAAAAGMNVATLSEVERGVHGATLGTVRKWAAALGLELVLRPAGSTTENGEPR